MDGGVTIRALRGDDSLDALTELLHRAYAPLAARGLRFLATHQDAATTRRRIANAQCLVAVAADDGRIVGTATWAPGRPGASHELYRRPEVASFGQFGVDPAWKGRGVGRALLDEVERRARDAGCAELACDTAAPATDLIAMYERRGFRVVGRARWDGVNYESVLLAKALRPGASPRATR